MIGQFVGSVLRVLPVFVLCVSFAGCGGGSDEAGAANVPASNAAVGIHRAQITRSALVVSGPKTYYVDAVNGQDVWSGTTATPLGSRPTDGPWQSLKTVAERSFRPGDTILLKCGQTWREPLSLGSSGNAASPITVGTYPDGCTDKPLIDGTTAVPSQAWSLHSGKIFKTQLPLDLLADQPLNVGAANWAVWSTNGDARISSSSICGTRTPPCMAATSGASGQTAVYGPLLSLGPNYSYTLRFSAKAPVGVTFKALIRRNSDPWDTFGVNQAIVGTGDWVAYTFDFTPTTSVQTARFNIEIPPGSVSVSVDDLTLTQNATSVLAVNMNGRSLAQAHHPNAGHDPIKPTSVYFKVGANSIANAAPGSDYLIVGDNFNLGTSGTVQAGQKLLLRSTPWLIEERTIAGMSGSTLQFSPPSLHAPTTESGFVLVGSLWMLDEPGEWHYDATTRTLYVWMPDSLAPGKRISVTTLATGVDLTARSYVNIKGLGIRGVGVGVQMAQSVGISVRSTSISDTVRTGIDISAASAGILERNILQRTGADAIARIAPAAMPNQMVISSNTVLDSAVTTLATGQWSLPTFSVAAIHTGTSATVTENSITRSAYHGIMGRAGTEISRNVVTGSCAVMDDCGGIYVMGDGNNNTISGNVISDLQGSTAGTARSVPLVVGIYLDELSSGVTVRGNTVVNAEHGILLHNANSNLIEGNTLYGNRSNQLWLSASSATQQATGDVYNNTVRSNQFFSTTTTPAVLQETLFSSPTAFASYDGNIYSALTNSYLVREKSATADQMYTLPTWKAATDATGHRNLEPNGRQVTPVGYTSFEVSGPSIVTNGDFANGIGDWQHWSLRLPAAQMALENAGGFQAIRLTGGEPYSLFYPQNFGVVAGQVYRLAFDMKTGVQNQRVTVALKRGGGGSNGFELLSDGFQYLYGSTAWKRYTVTFKANKTVNFQDPMTGDNGARLEFRDVMRGEVIRLARIELVPTRAVGTILRTNILVNKLNTLATAACPAQGASAVCTQYVDFLNSQPVGWPVTLGPLGSQIVYTRDSSIVDSDNDGISDLQDFCPETPLGLVSNARGCAIGQ